MTNEDEALVPPRPLALLGGGTERDGTGRPIAAGKRGAEPDRLRADVQAAAKKAGTKAVEFGIWLDGCQLLTMALGSSMSTLPATTDMHYRIGESRKPLCPRSC